MSIAFEALPVKANTQPWSTIASAFQCAAPFSSVNATASSNCALRCVVIATVYKRKRANVQREHQSGRLGNFARILECVVCVGECSLRVTKHPQG